MNIRKIYSKEFEEYHSNLFDFDEFIKWIQRPLRKSIRVNSIKITPDELFEKLGWKYERIPWVKSGSLNGFFVDEKYGLGATIEHALGHYYIQEASSMMSVCALGVSDGDTVLDLCAAPGSNTTQIGELNLSGTIVANDSNRKRIKSLVANLGRIGIMNCIVTNNDGSGFHEIKHIKGKFDKVLVDAPCSEVGTARKNIDALKIWTPGQVKRLSVLQKKLITSGFECLKPGGVMVYSTCTTSIEENEEVVKFLLENFENAKTEKISPDMRYDSCYEVDAARVYPWHNDTECAFIAKIKKEI